MVKITDRFYINATANCYSLQEKTKIKDKNSKNFGQDIYKDLGYYTTLEGCLKGVLKITTREFVSLEKEKDIKELIKQIKTMKNYLEELNLKI